MKKVLASVFAAASMVAVATTVNSANVFGVLKVATGVTSKQDIMISVPWVTVGTSGDTISPTALVATTGLTEDDFLLYYDGSAWHGWKVNSSTNWEATAVSVDKLTVKAGSAEVATRGTALFLNTSAENIYLNGQYKSGTKAVEIANATSDPAYTLIAPLSTSDDLQLNGEIWTGTPGDDDMIVVSFGKIFKYKTDPSTSTKKWGLETTTQDQMLGFITTYDFSAASTKIPVGRGAWYVRAATTGTLTVTL